ncbi:restriction endonuclease subunit S [uncultured Fibrobacter sp.]|uniref:restriction endonuclease subunit S n=1 Tax=uncultured Fibrobacter sp. TaxID=261512 RepID=UPI0025E02126|nr:restriction endonuclease subunit S [uncultured Fibrobacter sp.]
MEYVTLGNYCSITSSKRIFADQYVEKGVPFYRSKEIIEKNNGQDISEPLYIEPEVYETIKKKFGVPQKGDLLLTSVGTIGIPYIVKDEQFYFKDGNLTWMRNFSKELSSKYLYYWISSKFGKVSLVNRCIGSSQAALTIDILKNYKLFIPKRDIQDKVISILSAYDNLIENNDKRIKILEQMAENLYKEWFVRFRFPGHETTRFVPSNMGKIPSTFTLAKMQDVFEYYIGGGWGEDEYSSDFPVEAKVIRGADFPFVERGDLGTCPNRFHKESNYKARKLEPGDIILEVSGGTAEQPVGRTILVSQQMLDRFNGQVICASFCKLVRLKKEKISPVYFYYWMQFLYETRIIDRFQLQSTGIINFKFEYFLKKGDVMLPPSEIMKKFEDLVSPIHAQIEKLAMETENLIKQRDLLLPRLMSGKLAV